MLGNGIYYCSAEYLAHCSAELSSQNMIRSSPASQSHNGANGGRGHNPYLIQILRRLEWGPAAQQLPLRFTLSLGLKQRVV